MEAERMRKVISVFFLCLLVLGAAGRGWAGPAKDVSVEDVSALYTAIADNTVTSITITGTIDLEATPVTSNDIEISHDVTISGGLGGLINGNSFPIFRINNDAKVSFDGVTFENASGGTAAIRVVKGEAIFNGGMFQNNTAGAVSVEAGEATFTGVAFQGNTTTGNGGAVNVEDGTVTFNGGAFTGNSATGNGGAVNVEDGTVTFNGGAFTDNSATGNGGAIYSTIPLFLDGKFTFNNNSASGNGGAVAADTLNVTGGTYSGNTAGGTGGALYGAASVTVSDGTFKNNGKPGGTGTATTPNGGAIGSAGTVNVSGGTFDGNEVTVNGGAINAQTLFVSGGTYSGNTAGETGGALYGAASVTVSDGTFNNNGKPGGTGTATTLNGGAIGSAGTVNVSGGTFDGNEVTGNGGAIYAEVIKVKPAAPLASITFDSNKAQGNGGALYAANKALTEEALTAEDTIFTNNVAESDSSRGGATYSDGLSKFTNCVFGKPEQRNRSKGNGGAVYAGIINAKETTFRGNHAERFGGAVELGSSEKENRFELCLFEDNTSNQDGGAVYGTGDKSEVKFITSVFRKNFSKTQGGAATLSGADILFSRCTFESNTVNLGDNAKGGAVYITGPGSSSRFANCTFVGNNLGSGENGTGSGGALCIEGKTAVIFYCTFVGNVAGGGLGGAFYTTAGTLNVAASAFVENNATRGEDTFRGSGIINSEGWNILTNHGAGEIGGVNWYSDVTGWGTLEPAPPSGYNRRDSYKTQSASDLRESLFGANELTSNRATDVGDIETGSSLDPLDLRRKLETLALADTSPPGFALDRVEEATAIFIGYFADVYDRPRDERGAIRPNPSGGNSDVGAYESESGVIPPPPGPVGKTIREIKMSEIPNTMVRVGQTCSLTALVYYNDGTSSGSERVVWNSSNDTVARIDQYGNLVSLVVSPRPVVISVTIWGIAQDGNTVEFTDSHALIVSEEWSDYDNNIHPDVWKRLGVFNSSLQEDGEQITFLDFDPDVMKRSPFASAFKSAYGVAPTQATEISDSMIQLNSAPSLPGGTSLKPSVSITLSGASPASGGGVLPVRVIYSLSWDEVSDILGRQVTKIDSAKELFGKLNLAFTDRYGKESVLVDAGGEGVDASGKALTMTSGNNLTLTFDVFLSDANAASDGKPRLIENKYLTAADGSADGSIAGSLWLLKSKSGGDPGEGSGENGGGGGGGCDAGFGFFALLASASAGALLSARGNRPGLK
jgi:predicted outer membrane repeat protein